MTKVTYPCYVKIQGNESEEFVELPTEEDGTLLLTTVASQFPGAVGLRFKSESGSWRGVSLNENVLNAPLEGWGDAAYSVVMPKKAEKRKAIYDEDESPLEKMSRMTDEEILCDLVVLSLPFSATKAEVEAHFEQYGELDMCEIKYDADKKSRGFGFIRYKTVEAVKAVFEATHVLQGRELDVCFPKDKTLDDGTPTKLFVGRLPKGLTVEEFREHFEKFGVLKDAYIPTPFRGYGFVSFKKQSAARLVLKSTHVIKGGYVNVSHPTPKKSDTSNQGVGNQGVGNQGFGNQGFGNQGVGNQGFGNQGFGNQGFGNQGFGNQGFGNPGYGNQGFGNSGYGNMQGMQGQMQKANFPGGIPQSGSGVQGNMNYGMRR